jgi:hypothetical protein
MGMATITPTTTAMRIMPMPMAARITTILVTQMPCTTAAAPPAFRCPACRRTG